ncbi:HDOD domain-containing protein [Desulfoluna sp.]|uniref:HDOD domain-containing protein n=1 Tax=Desulfoluna sp. TaxID=2045199 RepID=UPI00260BBD7C|nr:HDOD domain-containing protein [Desulfoluna sp.]
MKIQCSGCSKAYRINDNLVHQIYTQKVLCTDCGRLIPVEPFLLDPKELEPFLSGEALKHEVVNNLKKLYPMPHILLKARKLLAGTGNFQALGDLLNTDPALASRVLKVANSAYYGMSGRVSSLQMAATVLGSGTLLQIILLIGNAKALGRSLDGYGLNAGDLWRHALATAVCAELVAKKAHCDTGEDAFFAGLMHDAGKIILDTYVLERKHLFQKYAKLTHAPLHDAETKILGFTHGDIGYELCRKWNLPVHMATAIKDHHPPSTSGQAPLTSILQLANHMAGLTTGRPSGQSIPPLLLKALHTLQITEHELEELIGEASTAVETLEEDTY